MTDIIKQFGEFFAGIAVVAGPLVVKYTKRKIEESNFTKKKLDIATLVSDRLAEMRIAYAVDRISIVEFSNGDKSVSGFPFLFTTMTYEKVGYNISHQQHLTNKVPASWYVDFNAPFTDPKSKYGRFYDDGRYKIDEQSEGISEEIGKTLKGFGSKSNWTFKISKNISLGLVILTSIDEHRVFSEEMISCILGDCAYIENLFKQRPQ